MLRSMCPIAVLALAVVAGLSVADTDPASGLAEADITLKSAGPLAFGPPGVLFVADPAAATIYAIETTDKSAESTDRPNISGINEKIASMLGTKAGDIRFADVAVNPTSGTTYLSVARGTGPKATPVLLKVTRKGEISEVSLKKVRSSKTTLANANEKNRSEAITQLAFLKGRLLVAGLSNEEFASNLRSIPFPFDKTNPGAGVEIFHGAHGKFETKSPIRVFAPYKIGDEENILAAYTCTPLVKLPVKSIEPGAKIKAVTVAELGNRNRPLSMIVYNKGGKDFVLLANSARGLMKISLDGIDKIEGITKRVSDKAGLNYETIKNKEGVQKLDAFGKEHALILVKAGESFNLETIELP